ncbi:HNH endonuclease signature motif containing protein [Streptomyces sp. NPDC045369]|uniref:HNH endonuclease n=1 Tax=Streptomyces sp. NPDC045369 TaxID=3155732 RepID=UPI0033E474C4
MDPRPPWSTTSARNQSRTPGWSALRLRILRRDAYRCYLCGSPRASEVDHITPVSAGGTDAPLNLAACCRSCHRAKTQRESQRRRKP